jgi:uncharacterized pyridoxal phosphate-containing UPF0001 family protein
MADLAPSTLEHALHAVRTRIASAAIAAGRLPADVTLVAVSKTHPAAAVAEALAAGQLIFGENRVQEAAAKFPPLRAAHPDLRLHLIGALQTNKAEEAVRLADTIESLDRPRLANAIEAAAQKTGRLPALLIQVNIGDAFIDACRTRFGESLQGLMCIPPADQPPEPYFEALAALRSKHALPILSMGMSGDFETAISLGATHVRVGSAIFGTRPSGA